MSKIIQWFENHVNWYGWFIGLFVLAIVNVIVFTKLTAFPLDKVITIILLAAGIFSFALLFRFSYQIMKHDMDEKHEQIMTSLQLFEQKVNGLLTAEQSNMKYKMSELGTAISRSQMEITRTIHSQSNQNAREDQADIPYFAQNFESVQQQIQAIQENILQQMQSVQESMQKQMDEQLNQLENQMNEKLLQLTEKLATQPDNQVTTNQNLDERFEVLEEASIKLQEALLETRSGIQEKLSKQDEIVKQVQLAVLDTNDQVQAYLDEKLSKQDEVIKQVQLAVLDTSDQMQEYLDKKNQEQMDLLKTFQFALLDTNDHLMALTNEKASVVDKPET